MNLMKYLVVAGISLVIAVLAGVMGNVLSGILIFVLLFGGYILLNVTKVMKTEEPQVVPTQVNRTQNTTVPVPPKDN
jgi:hypothetical protein